MYWVRGATLRWWASLILFLPVVALYACEYLGGGGGTFTGFIQYDQPYYMANARKFFDGGFHFFYGNPFSPDPQTPSIYFQIHLLVLGAIRALTGCDPGVLYVIYGFFAGIICIRVAIAIYEQVAGLETSTQWAGLILFVWGGGVLALVGLVYVLCSLRGGNVAPDDIFHFDPDSGWWFLNFGRNLIFPTEAYYHALAFGAVLMAMRKRFAIALWLAFFLSLSHPFTGLQFLLILLAWSATEVCVLRNKSVPFAFPAILLVLLVFHVGYYVFLLNLFPEHLALFEQWSQPWTEPPSAFIPADLLVGYLAWRAMRNSKLAVELFSDPVNRLLLAWFLVSFALVHHDLLTTPRQPLHFSRGYIWTPLFLLGVKPLLGMLQACFGMKNHLLRGAAIAAVFLIGLSDNIAWLGFHAEQQIAVRFGMQGIQDGFRLKLADRQLYRWLMKRPQPHTELLITPNQNLPLIYLAMVYTDYRAWYSHVAVTPFAMLRSNQVDEYFVNGTVPAEWQGKAILVILPKEKSYNYDSLVTPPLYENDSYSVRALQGYER